MKKILLAIIGIVSYGVSHAQFDYSPNGRNDAPVLGMQWGLTGGGYTSMLTNRDDIDADQRLDVETMNFTYAAGIEGIYWFERHIGFGGQLLYWNAGGKYTGLDTLTKIELNATTTMTRLKLPLMFYFKSYNRYYPNRRVRFNAMFGPYVSVLSGYTEDVRFTQKDNPNFKQYYKITGDSYSTDGLTGKLNAQLYKPFELGFTFGVGTEVRLWRKTVVALNVRTDIGISDVEDKRVMKMEYSNGTKDTAYSFFGKGYAKYVAATQADIQNGWQANRPATKNFSLGAFLSVRKYFGDKR